MTQNPYEKEFQTEKNGETYLLEYILVSMYYLFYDPRAVARGLA
jgi:hypothetical protein